MKLENPDLEKTVLAAMIADVQHWFALSGRLPEEVFTSSLNRAIYRDIGRQATKDGRVSHRMLTHNLQDEHEQAGPYIAALVAMSRDSDDIAHAEDFAETLVDLYMRRSAEKAIEDARKAMESVSTVAERTIIDLQEKLSEITDLSAGGRRQSAGTVIQSVVDYAATAAKGDITGVSWPLQGLQRLLGDTMPGEVVLIGGNPGGGKTALMMQSAMHMSVHNSGLVFEKEMTNLGVMKRWVAGTVDMPLRAIDRGDTSADQFAAMNDLLTQSSDLRLDLVPGKMPLSRIRAQAMAVKKIRGLRHLWVDHIKLVPYDSKWNLSIHDRVYRNVAGLQEIAQELGICVFVLCHLTKGAREREDHPEPKMEDFYGGGIEEFADVMFATFNRHDWLQKHPPRVQSPKKKDEHEAQMLEAEGLIEIHKLKHRRMKPTGVEKLRWIGKRTMLQDVVQPQRDLLGEEPAF